MTNELTATSGRPGREALIRPERRQPPFLHRSTNEVDEGRKFSGNEEAGELNRFGGAAPRQEKIAAIPVAGDEQNPEGGNDTWIPPAPLQPHPTRLNGPMARLHWSTRSSFPVGDQAC